jgi:hypothetical protein
MNKHNIYIRLIPGLLLIVGVLHGQPQRTLNINSQNRAALSTPMLIEQNRARGEITLDQWAMYQAYAFRAPEQLPIKFRSSVPEKCGTWILDDIHRNWNTLSLPTRTSLIKLGWTTFGTLARPTGLDSTRGTAIRDFHFCKITEEGSRIKVQMIKIDEKLGRWSIGDEFRLQ